MKICREGVILIEPDDYYADQALILAMNYTHPFYDMLFVEQAIKTHEVLVTGDRSQADVASRCGVEVVRV